MIESDPIPHGPLLELKQQSFGHSIVGLHAHHLRCVHSLKHGLGWQWPSFKN
jgi:hypothetical protein